MLLGIKLSGETLSYHYSCVKVVEQEVVKWTAGVELVREITTIVCTIKGHLKRYVLYHALQEKQHRVFRK